MSAGLMIIEAAGSMAIAAAPGAEHAGSGVEPPTGYFGRLLGVVIVALCVAMGATAFRLVKGPSLADRVVALDLLASFIVGAIGVFSMQTGRFEFVSVAIVMALILFVGTAAFALYLEKSGRRQ
ncbi:MAG: monovalent cation/H+ antiporter complex subunit F [Planctomycetota bacterium]